MLHQNEHGSNLPTVFNYGEKNKLRSIIQDEQPWFAAIDVCNILEHTNASVVIRMLEDDERAKLSLGRQGSTWFVNESGLYNLILKSNKPEARKFRKWVTNEVLPALRKTGHYSIPLAGLKTMEVGGQPCYNYVQLLNRIGLSTRSGSMSARRRKNPQEFHYLNRTWLVTSRFADYMLTIAKYRSDQDVLRKRKLKFLKRQNDLQLQLFGKGVATC